MRNLILFDDEIRDNLLPLTYTRPVCELRVGVSTIREKWERALDGKASFITREYLTGKYPITIGEDNLVINGSVLPSPLLVRLIDELSVNEALVSNGDLVAARIPGNEFDSLIDGSFGDDIAGYSLQETPVKKLTHLWQIFTLCGEEIAEDFEHITKGRKSAALSGTNSTIGEHPVFVEEGVWAEHVIFNTTKGPIYLGKNALIMEGSMLRGPVAIGEGGVVKMGTKIYGASSFGPFCKVGGEINNVVMQAHSNKGHDGYLGNSVIGEWCNIGADANASNLKNTYSSVKLWSYAKEKFEDTGLTFCGLIMGDHSKCGINTMFNTGTVVGVSANVYGAGFVRNFVPSFSWGGPQGMKTFNLDKAFETAEAVMSRRKIEFPDTEKSILSAVFEMSAVHRRWDKS
ncbi:MAG: glucose-1-phosphate thymidylyltransferase [Bacteroidetes bacterium]|nr:MAG: glucose-1-phosphate thymidylyltransferase [Bacteroidota bacterium]